MRKKTLIFIGSSGSGKGTQAKKIQEYFKIKKEKTTYIELGSEFRDFLKMNTSTSKISQKISKTGELQPEFLSIYLWAKMFNLYYSLENNLILDGTPRTKREAYILEGALKFYKIKKPYVIYLKTNREISKKRMLDRNREDDSIKIIGKRLDWFDEKVMDVIKYFKENDYYNFLEIDGTNKIEKINKELMKKTNLN